ncbi:MAG: MBL fold metallo-hydrolase [Chloroflexi bacterium]|nr:MBL fold metallo-hydrolase [Chloroflexota bacterium]
MQVRQFVDEGLGNSTHLVISERTGLAALIDPLRDVNRYLDAAAAMGARVSHVFETHVHNDFITGSRELAARVGARIVASAAAGLEFEHDAVSDGDAIAVGDVCFTVLATPGHTPEHISFLARDLITPEASPVLFSGGSLLVGAVSRTDLLGHEHAAGLGRHLYHSLHEKILPLPDDVAVYPTHGAGSFCTATSGAARQTTIGEERRTNPFLQLATPDELIAELARVMPSYPTYFRHMRAINRLGPPLLSGIPQLEPLAAANVAARMARGEAMVDIRPVARYLEGHIPGVFHVELRPAFAAWVGWVVPFATPIVLVSETTDVHDEAIRQLVRIGYDELPGYLADGMPAWEQAGLPIARLPVLTVAQVRDRLRRGEPLVVLDVRQDAEWADGHIDGARHVEAGALAANDPFLSRTLPIAAHCGHEQRSATALSVLERHGYTNLNLIEGGWSAWQEAGYPVADGTGVR